MKLVKDLRKSNISFKYSSFAILFAKILNYFAKNYREKFFPLWDVVFWKQTSKKIQDFTPKNQFISEKKMRKKENDPIEKSKKKINKRNNNWRYTRN